MVHRQALAPLLVAALAALGGAQTLPLPPRPPGAPTGSQVLPLIQGLSVAKREELLLAQIGAGNVPAFVRQLVPVTTTAAIGGKLRTALFWVTPDYVAVGSDADFFRMPMTPTLGQQVADLCQAALPTRRMVDAIWSAAPIHLAPFPYSPTSNDILSPALFYQHHLKIEQQRAGNPLGPLVGGIKKDVVVSSLIASNPGKVVIYGWHQLNGAPIQPLFAGHVDFYADYSHGIRLVQRAMSVDGAPTSVAAVLADALLFPLLSDEGAFTSSRYPVPTPPEGFPLIDPFPATGRALASWKDKFTTPLVQAFAPLSPGGDGSVLVVRDPTGGTDSTRIGSQSDKDYAVQADLYCEFRPQLVADGYERIGIFARDNASGAFDGTLSQAGACYALTWDSDDGRLRCARIAGGVIADLLPKKTYLASSGWRRFRIDAQGSKLVFRVNGAKLLETSDSTFPAGELGIGFHEYFATNANLRGTRADNFLADSIGATALALTPGAGPGSIVLDNRRGVPKDIYVTAVSASAGAFPLGPFFGIDIAPALLAAELASGHPAFLGLLDAAGASHVVVPGGIASGLILYAVTVDVDPFGEVVAASPPVVFTTQ